jgi:hypothetical protein
MRCEPCRNAGDYEIPICSKPSHNNNIRHSITRGNAGFSSGQVWTPKARSEVEARSERRRYTQRRRRCTERRRRYTQRRRGERPASRLLQTGTSERFDKRPKKILLVLRNFPPFTILSRYSCTISVEALLQTPVGFDRLGHCPCCCRYDDDCQLRRHP